MTTTNTWWQPRSFWPGRGDQKLKFGIILVWHSHRLYGTLWQNYQSNGWMSFDLSTVTCQLRHEEIAPRTHTIFGLGQKRPVLNPPPMRRIPLYRDSLLPQCLITFGLYLYFLLLLTVIPRTIVYSWNIFRYNCVTLSKFGHLLTIRIILTLLFAS